jgi:16S rRNA U516 pseudouridylate synthase RsuA-like enzyme
MMIRLNRFLATTGIASRRKSDQLIKDGLIKVNGKVCTAMGKTIDEKKDIVEYKGRILKIKKENVYVVLNKPRGYITTVKDEKNRRTVMDLLKIKQRVYPVGRLDYDSEGLILMTDDGDLAYKLTHPFYSYYVYIVVSYVCQILFNKNTISLIIFMQYPTL